MHDLGGMQGFGPVQAEPDEPPFHEAWEGRVHGLVLALIASGNIRGNFRHAIERMDPAHYLSSSYYEHWLTAVETLLVEAGTLTQDELRRPSATAFRRENAELASRVRALLSPFGVRDREAGDARFAPGERVLVRRLHAPGHTRCPRYVRGIAGVVLRVHEFALLPDDSTAPPEPYYTVVFASADVWGRDAERFAVSVDLFQSYLEEAS